MRRIFGDGGYAGDKLRAALKRMGRWKVRSPNDPTPPKDSKSCRAAGLSSALSLGSGDVAGWRKISR
jgi:transposase